MRPAPGRARAVRTDRAPQLLRQVLAGARDAAQSVLDAPGSRVSVPDNDRAVYAEQEGAAVVFGIYRVPHPHQARAQDAGRQLAKDADRDRAPDHQQHLPRYAFRRLEHDVARKAVRHQHVGNSARDVPALDVSDETDVGFVKQAVRRLGEVVALARLLADVDEPDPRLAM